MTGPRPVDELPPEARFALRGLAAGLSIDEAGSVMRLDGPTVRKHLRTAARGLGTTAPPPSAGDEALLASLAAALDAAREPASKPPTTRCPAPDVLAALARGGLDGPLLLAEVDHAADCAACLARLVESRRSAPAPVTPQADEPKSVAPAVVGALAGLAAAVWWLLR